jgi:hypothetical protein
VESWKLLIGVGEAGDDLGAVPAGVRALIDQANQILVMSPALPGRLDWLAGQTNRTREIADERLAAVLGQLEEAGEKADGVVGSDDPLVAFEDAIRDFTPDHILIALRGHDEAGWQEKGLVDQVLERFQLPVTVFAFEG